MIRGAFLTTRLGEITRMRDIQMLGSKYINLLLRCKHGSSRSY
jgi:hypothetical protein